MSDRILIARINYYQPAKVYKIKHLSKIEVVQNDPSGCTFLLVRMPFSAALIIQDQWIHSIIERFEL